jgi:hypothetical protein
MTRPLTTIAALLFWVPAAPVMAQGYAPNLGEKHVEFTLPDMQTGKPVSLADFRGKKVLLIQFASW